ncbi:MAG: peptidoglycan-associated lipoprotein Pal [Pseudomonadales bacterium]|nr:peptidoglycan-associated lipoprotein Pal [Pseudomonadales bacterium]
MGTTSIRGLLAAIFATLLLAGCASSETDEMDTGMGPDTQEPEMTMEEPAPAPEPEQPAWRVSDQGKLVIDLPGSPLEELEGVVYFDFDQAIVKRGFHEELDKHAQFLADNRNQNVRLEGHADERGTREYNLALGERRANAVRAYLVAQGASGSQIEVISFGEEQPAVMGSNEAAWAKNRRVEIVYR